MTHKPTPADIVDAAERVLTAALDHAQAEDLTAREMTLYFLAHELSALAAMVRDTATSTQEDTAA